MGALGSKAARDGIRKFPTRAPGSAPPPSTVRVTRLAPETPSRPQASYTKEDAFIADSVDPTGEPPEFVDPAFADRLKQMGVAQPNPTFSPSSTAAAYLDSLSVSQSLNSKPQFPPASSNATLSVLEARRRLQAEAEKEFDEMGRPGTQGREFLDIGTIRNILVLRQHGEPAAEIESRLRLKPGIVARLGPSGIVSPT